MRKARALVRPGRGAVLPQQHFPERVPATERFAHPLGRRPDRLCGLLESGGRGRAPLREERPPSLPAAGAVRKEGEPAQHVPGGAERSGLKVPPALLHESEKDVVHVEPALRPSRPRGTAVHQELHARSGARESLQALQRPSRPDRQGGIAP